VLLSAGAAVDAKYSVSMTVISRASLNSLQRGGTALEIACRNGHAEVVSVLLSGGVMVDSRDLVSALLDNETVFKSESEFFSGTVLLCTLLVKEAMQRWFLCCYQLELWLKLEIG
jgi:ankyrin repeat protein